MTIFIPSQLLIWQVKETNPIIFEYALGWPKPKEKNSIMIGDSLDADVQGALDMGLTLFFNEKKKPILGIILNNNHLLR
jgi:putative hydrolase of the HAD superfamily